MKIKIATLFFLLLSSISFATMPYTFVPKDEVKSAEMNANFNYLDGKITSVNPGYVYINPSDIKNSNQSVSFYPGYDPSSTRKNGSVAIHVTSQRNYSPIYLPDGSVLSTVNVTWFSGANPSIPLHVNIRRRGYQAEESSSANVLFMELIAPDTDVTTSVKTSTLNNIIDNENYRYYMEFSMPADYARYFYRAKLEYK